jgi:hypothetical protein
LCDRLYRPGAFHHTTRYENISPDNGFSNHPIRQEAGQREQAQEFQERAFKCYSYDEVLAMLDDYVEVE